MKASLGLTCPARRAASAAVFGFVERDARADAPHQFAQAAPGNGHCHLPRSTEAPARASARVWAFSCSGISSSSG